MMQLWQLLLLLALLLACHPAAAGKQQRQQQRQQQQRSVPASDEAMMAAGLPDANGAAAGVTPAAVTPPAMPRSGSADAASGGPPSPVLTVPSVPAAAGAATAAPPQTALPALPAALPAAAAAWPAARDTSAAGPTTPPSSSSKGSSSSSRAPLFTRVANLTLVFPVLPMAAAPSPPPAYRRVMHRWAFAPDGSLGYIIVTRRMTNPRAGLDLAAALPEEVHSELVLFPGKFAPRGCGGKRRLHSAQRFWTDDSEGGGDATAMPAEPARFVWGPRSVEVTSATGQLLFAASFTGRLRLAAAAAAGGSRTGASLLSRQQQAGLPQEPGGDWFTPVARAGISTVQWPLSGPATAAAAAAGRSPAGRAAAAAGEAAADKAAASGGAGSVLMPVTQTLRWNPDAVVVTLETASVVYDPVALSGSASNVPLVSREMGTGFIPDSPATFSQPPAKLLC